MTHEQSEGCHPWTTETMQIINALTPHVKDKAFDPDWFLLRQRFEELEADRDALKNELAMLNGNEEAVHLGALAAISAIHQMDGMKRQNALLRKTLQSLALWPASYPANANIERMRECAKAALARIPDKASSQEPPAGGSPQAK